MRAWLYILLILICEACTPRTLPYYNREYNYNIRGLCEGKYMVWLYGEAVVIENSNKIVLQKGDTTIIVNNCQIVEMWPVK